MRPFLRIITPVTHLFSAISWGHITPFVTIVVSGPPCKHSNGKVFSTSVLPLLRWTPCCNAMAGWTRVKRQQRGLSPAPKLSQNCRWGGWCTGYRGICIQKMFKTFGRLKPRRDIQFCNYSSKMLKMIQPSKLRWYLFKHGFSIKWLFVCEPFRTLMLPWCHDRSFDLDIMHISTVHFSWLFTFELGS